MIWSLMLCNDMWLTMVDLSGNVPFRSWKKLHALLTKLFLEILIRFCVFKISLLLVAILRLLGRLGPGWALFLEIPSTRGFPPRCLFFFHCNWFCFNLCPEKIIYLSFIQWKCHGGLVFTPKITFLKVDVPNLVTYLYQTPIFEWCLVRCRSQYWHMKDACLKEIGLRAHVILIILGSIVNIIGARGTYMTI